MLNDIMTAYVELHHATGFKFEIQASMLRCFVAFAEARGDEVVRATTVLEWAALASSPRQRCRRILLMRRFALAVKVEDPRHEVPPLDASPTSLFKRNPPYIYTADDITRLLQAAARMPPQNTIKPVMYTTLFGLLVATGLRIGEALALRMSDISEDGLIIRNTKCRKNRLVPLHETTRQALDAYMVIRKRYKTSDDSIFILRTGHAPVHETVRTTFLQLAVSVGLREKLSGRHGPRIHDLRHTFAVRSLEQCGHSRDEVTRHMAALGTYLGHTLAVSTYWYLEATPILMKQIAEAAEGMHQGVAP